MGQPVFIGDEVTAAGFRLAGLAIRVPEPGGAQAALREAREHAPLVLITAAAAAELPAGELRAAVSAAAPPTVVVGDVSGRRPAPDVGAEMRRELGMEG